MAQDKELPSGLDRGDGLNGRLGTPTPDGARIVDTANNDGEVVDEELPDSPTIQRAEQGTITHSTRHDWNNAITRILTLNRGVIRVDSGGNVTKILSVDLQHERADTGVLKITEESLSFDLPPDTFQVTPVELSINILKHPRYFSAFIGDGIGSDTEQKNQMVINMLQHYFENPNAQFRDSLKKLFMDSIGTDGTAGEAEPKISSAGAVTPAGAKITGTDFAKYAAMEIIQKYWRGEETPYIVGFQITWSRFYRNPNLINPGGYVENPIYEANPQVPAGFVFTDPPDNTIDTFSALAQYNPQCYSSDGTSEGQAQISWLRKSDQQEFDRTLTRVDRTWIGSPVGYWDLQLYNRDRRPAAATASTDYLRINTN